MEQDDVMALHMEGGEDVLESPHPMAELLEQEFASLVPKRGEVMEGTIVGISSNEILIDIGCKCEGYVSSRDLEHLDPEFRKSLHVGDSVLAYVIRPEDADGNIVLSLSRAQVEGDWKDATRLFEAEEIFEEPVVGYNKGGLIVNVGSVRGFVPASQIVSVRLPRDAEDEGRSDALDQLVGQPLRLKIIELDRRRNRLILSERAAVREWRQGQKERLLDELQEGNVRHGVVSSLCDFGAFVDLGGADGLVHLSELSWRRVGHAKQVLTVGQEVDVYVLGVDRDRRRIALSIKRLQKEPWSTVEERFEIGQLIDGTITKLTNFGAFARVDDDIEGLIHISELSEERIAHPKDVVSEGQGLTLRVIRIDASRQRLGLSLRRVSDEQYTADFEWDGTDPSTDLEDGEDQA
ncbi:MAG: 30S ribosomal protein S1 [Anaerolineae bacterium]